MIDGYSPAWLWRGATAFAGITLYGLSIRWTARSMVSMVKSGVADLQEVRLFVLAAYFGGGAVMTIASALNAVSPNALLEGMCASFGLNWGCLLIPRVVARRSGDLMPANLPTAPTSFVWVVVALAIGGAFITILGPGVRLPG